MQAVISDSSPLIYLTRLGQILLLRKIYNTIVVPEAVWTEIAVGGRGFPEAAAIQEAVRDGWIQRKASKLSLAPPSQMQLGRGEMEAIALASELHALLLTDDADARGYAESIGVTVTGTLGVLARAKREEHLASLRPILDRLRSETSFRVSQSLYEKVLRANGEDPS